MKDDKIVICGKPDRIESFTNNKDLIKDLISVSKAEDASSKEDSKKLGFLRFFDFMKKFNKDSKND